MVSSEIMSQTTWNWLITIIGGVIVAALTPFITQRIYDNSAPQLVREDLVATEHPAPVANNAEVKSEASKPDIGKLTDYVEWTYLRDREQYADAVEYYDKGVVNRDFVAKDKAVYAARWPVRRYILIPGSVYARHANGESVVTFSYTYVVSNGSKRVDGNGRVQIRLKLNEDQYLVTGAKEIAQSQPPRQ